MAVPRSAQSFQPEFRIRKRSEFEAVQAAGKRLQTRNFLILVAATDIGRSRIGTIITRKIDKRAVCRNLIRRRIREIFRRNRVKLTKICDMVIIARRGAQDCSYTQIEQQIMGALQRARLVEETVC